MSIQSSAPGRLTRLRDRIAGLIRDDRGFNLIEVLTVSVIMAALLGIVLAQFGNYKDRAHIAQLRSDTRLIAQSFEMVYSEQGHYPTVVAPTVGADGKPAIELANGTLDAYVPIYSVPISDGVNISAVELIGVTGEDFRVTLEQTGSGGTRVAVWNTTVGGFESD